MEVAWLGVAELGEQWGGGYEGYDLRNQEDNGVGVMGVTCHGTGGTMGWGFRGLGDMTQKSQKTQNSCLFSATRSRLGGGCGG